MFADQYSSKESLKQNFLGPIVARYTFADIGLGPIAAWYIFADIDLGPIATVYRFADIQQILSRYNLGPTSARYRKPMTARYVAELHFWCSADIVTRYWTDIENYIGPTLVQ